MVDKMKEVPYPGVVPWLAVRKKINEIIEEGGSGGNVDWNDVQNKPSFATVATSGSYNDLSNQPTIPSIQGLATEQYVANAVSGKAGILTGTTAPTTSTEATVGDFYLNTSDGKLYQLKDDSSSTYVWEEIGSDTDNGQNFLYYQENVGFLESDWTTPKTGVYNWLRDNPYTEVYLLYKNQWNYITLAARIFQYGSQNLIFSTYSTDPTSSTYSMYSVGTNDSFSATTGTTKLAAPDIRTTNYMTVASMSSGETASVFFLSSLTVRITCTSKNFIKALIDGDITGELIQNSYNSFELKFTANTTVDLSDRSNGVLKSSFISTGESDAMLAYGGITNIFYSGTAALLGGITYDSHIDVGPFRFWYDSSWYATT